MIDRQRIYNFIRGHQALGGKTPAEMANIDLNLEGNRRLSTIRKQIRDRTFRKTFFMQSLHFVYDDYDEL